MQRLRKNVAGQTITLLAVDANGVPKTGDAGNLTAYVEKDASGSFVALADTSATELDTGTNVKGLYRWSVSQSEVNADNLIFAGKSSTSGVTLVPVQVATEKNTAEEIYDYLANNPWNLIAMWNKLVWGIPATELMDKANFGLSASERTTLASAIRTNLQGTQLPVDAKAFNGHTLTGDGSSGDPIRAVP